MNRPPPPLRLAPFIAKLEQASAEGRADFIAANMPRLEKLIAECMEWSPFECRPSEARSQGLVGATGHF